MSKFIPEGLYFIDGIGLAHVSIHTQYSFFARATGNEHRRLSPGDFEHARRIKEPTSTELMQMVKDTTLKSACGTLTKEDKQILWQNLYLQLAFELGLLKIATAGHFPNHERSDFLRFHLAGKISQGLEWEARKARWEEKQELGDWFVNPSKAYWDQVVGKPLEVDAWEIHCPTTGKSFAWEFDGTTIRVIAEIDSKTLRKKPLVPFTQKHLTPLEIEYEVPTGELVFANDLRKYFPEVRDDVSSVNSAAGRQLWSKGYAANGLILAFGGDTGAYVFRTRTGIKVRAWCGEREVQRSLGSVCLDLHWVSIADRSRLPKDFDFKMARAFTVNVKPGKYQVAFLKDSEEATVCTLTKIV